jgi:dTDP-4-dehydrorhamnose 3,5-epimerase
VKVVPTPLSGVLVIEPDVYADPRGYFLESFHENKYKEIGIVGPFIQTNISKSCQRTLRGLHAQLTHPQAKLVQIIQGTIWDVVVDVRPDSPTFKKWFAETLSSDKPRQIYVPIGFAHGFCALSDVAVVEYKCSDVYDPANELHLLWNDPAIGISWPVQKPLLSAKDQAGITLANSMPLLSRHFATTKSK